MTIWLLPKAKPNEKKNRKKSYSNKRPSLCRICGKPIDNSGHICNSCKDFINRKRQEEREGQHEGRK